MSLYIGRLDVVAVIPVPLFYAVERNIFAVHVLLIAVHAAYVRVISAVGIKARHHAADVLFNRNVLHIVRQFQAQSVVRADAFHDCGFVIVAVKLALAAVFNYLTYNVIRSCLVNSFKIDKKSVRTDSFHAESRNLFFCKHGKRSSIKRKTHHL